jgi:integrase/recombinase XerD
MQELKQPPTKTHVKDIIEQVQNHMVELGYSKSSISHYRTVWRRFLAFSGEEYFSEELGMRYLQKYYDIPKTRYPGKLPHDLCFAFRIIRVLSDYERFGHIFTCRTKSPEVVWPVKYRTIMNEFLDNCKRINRSSEWMRKTILVMRSFIQFLDIEKIQSCETISSSTITRYISTQVGYSSNTMATNFSHLKSFLRYLYLNGYNKIDISSCIPKIIHSGRKHVPSIWTKEQVDCLLTAVDRGNPCGKRDYAMLLMIVRLGIRVSDVRNLQFINLKWDSKCVEFKQTKTGDTITLPLLEEVGWAIIDYLKYGRPKSNSQNVFIRHIAPFNIFGSNNNLFYLINKYLIAAKIETPSGNHHGMHSLRHTMANELLKQFVPLPTIAGILGHRTTRSTSNYLLVDIPMLALCALNVEVQNEED